MGNGCVGVGRSSVGVSCGKGVAVGSCCAIGDDTGRGDDRVVGEGMVVGCEGVVRSGCALQATSTPTMRTIAMGCMNRARLFMVSSYLGGTGRTQGKSALPSKGLTLYPAMLPIIGKRTMSVCKASTYGRYMDRLVVDSGGKCRYNAPDGCKWLATGDNKMVSVSFCLPDANHSPR